MADTPSGPAETHQGALVKSVKATLSADQWLSKAESGVGISDAGIDTATAAGDTELFACLNELTFCISELEKRSVGLGKLCTSSASNRSKGMHLHHPRHSFCRQKYLEDQIHKDQDKDTDELENDVDAVITMLESLEEKRITLERIAKCVRSHVVRSCKQYPLLCYYLLPLTSRLSRRSMLYGNMRQQQRR